MPDLTAANSNCDLQEQEGAADIAQSWETLTLGDPQIHHPALPMPDWLAGLGHGIPKSTESHTEAQQQWCDQHQVCPLNRNQISI